MRVNYTFISTELASAKRKYARFSHFFQLTRGRQPVQNPAHAVAVQLSGTAHAETLREAARPRLQIREISSRCIVASRTLTRLLNYELPFSS